ncbi:MAG: DUF4160 domain-containing protein [Bacteroides sp.]|nr:DUF4160 domain-containing protein [Bacteroides sp.]
MFFDDHNPPHFHVKYNDFRAIIDISNGTIKGNLPRRVVSLVYEWLDLHKNELMRNWQLMLDNQQPVQIKPLD